MSKPLSVFTHLNAGQSRSTASTAAQDSKLLRESLMDIDLGCGSGLHDSDTSRYRMVSVRGIGEVSVTPDRAKVLYTVTSSKDDVQDAKNSVTRRLDYIIQMMLNHQVRDSDLEVSKTLRMVDKLYHYTAQIVVVYHDYDKCETISNLLVEKLKDTITVTAPHYYHSPTKLDSCRQQASLLALRSAKNKAIEMAKLLQATVGKALLVQELSTNENQGLGLSDDPACSDKQRTIEAATSRIKVEINVKFELKHQKAKSSIG